MALADLSPSQRGRLRQLATLAYERELSRGLDALERDFHQWHAGRMSAKELASAIHDFHEGPNKRLWVLYRETDPTAAVARAVAHGLLRTDEVGADLVATLRSQIEFFRAAPELAMG